MSDFGDALVSRSDIARLAGVRRPAVTNWERRHPDFPAPVVPPDGGTEPEVFRAGEVLEWLSGRSIPSNALHPGEPAGTTYGDRFRGGLGGDRPGSLLSAVEHLTRRDAERVRGRLRMPDYLYLLLALVFVRSQEEERWSRYVKDTRAALRELELPEHAEVPLAEVVRFLDGGPPTSGEESRQAFDRLLELLSNTDPGGAGGFFTPRSVSHVMGGALAARRRAKRLHDPFCRTGELLTAYLEASAERGDETPVAVVGRTPTEELLPVVRMNLTMHGVEQAQVLQGPWMPGRLDESGDRPGSFDTVITNPPFGSLGPWPDAPPRYWRYGTTRSSEFDWLQYVVSCLSPDGRAAVLMPAGAGFRGSAERLTRTRLIQDGVVECVMALPTHLFERTAIQTHIWFLRSPGGRAEQVLFVDGTRLGSMATRTRRELSDAEIDRLVTVYTSWCEAGTGGMEQAGGAGLGRAVDTAEIEANDFRLEPALYVREHVPSAGAIDDQAAVRSHLAELSAHLERLHAEARATDGLVDKRLRRYGL